MARSELLLPYAVTSIVVVVVGGRSAAVCCQLILLHWQLLRTAAITDYGEENETRKPARFPIWPSFRSVVVVGVRLECR